MFFVRNKRVLLSSLSIEYDFHSHFLPGVDDGRFSLDSAADTIAKLPEFGVKKLNITPHVITGLYDNPLSKINSGYDLLRQKCSSLPSCPIIQLGAEYMCDDSFLQFVEEGANDIFKVDDNIVLIEMSYYAQSPQIFDIIFNLRLNGFCPVLAHPERYPYWAYSLENFDKVFDMECGFQINMLSLAGVYGKESMKILNYLLKNRYYSYVGSDLHSPEQLQMIKSVSTESKYIEMGEELNLWRRKK